ncbi:MAG: hypothetical protein GC192_17280 [Bacteroidetes bacterium]|nr:hypothetical protein [Bacteroidota bacterium]
MKIRFLILLGSFMIILSSMTAQTVAGFWMVDQVMVGERNLTPMAKWFKYETNNTYTAGNGWTQNDIGSWEYDEVKKEFSPESTNGKDGYGPFKVLFSDNKMMWKRMEDGMEVTVYLSRISEMPKSPKDMVAGNWGLLSVVENGTDITPTFDADHKIELLVRWTETFRRTNPDDSQSFGYWHMDAHEPAFHLIDFNRDIAIKVFYVSFKDDLLVMKEKDKDTVFTFKKK